MGEFINLEGSIIGNWKVIRYKGNSMWECECQCRNKTIKDVHRYSLLTGRSTSCGKCNIKASIKIGDHFGEWTVIGERDKNYKVLCRCSCKKEKMVSIYSLKDGRSTNCGHLKNLDRVQDLTDQVFGELTVKKYLGNQYWECECSCKEKCVKHRNHLLDGRATSCGHNSIPKPEDLMKEEFGWLRPVKYVGQKRWLCECKCGNKKIIRSANLKNGSTLSCDCILYKPTEEELIEKLVEFEVKNGHKPSLIDLANYLNISYNKISYHLNKYGLSHSKYMDTIYTSSGERELYRYVCSLVDADVLHNVKDVIKPYELDIYIPSEKLAIEFNGTYWHSDLNKESTYHQKKLLACEKLGIQLIHVYEYEWNNDYTKEKIKKLISNRLNNTNAVRLFARKLEVKQINNKVAIEFCDKYHMQNGTNANINIGLFNSEELVGVMTFGTPRFNSEYQYELIRLAFKDDTRVVGGAQKMLKFFIDNYKPESILSYCKLDKFNGRVYEQLGFSDIGISKPNYVWVNKEDVLTRYQTTVKELIKLGLGKEGDSESDIMTSLGYLRVFDSGNKKFVWIRG